VLKVTLCYFLWISLCLRVKIHCVGNTILAKLWSVTSRIWGRICSHSQNRTVGVIWRDTVPNRGDRGKNHHDTTFSMPVSVPHHHLPHTTAVHFLHSFIHGKTQVSRKVLHAVSNALKCRILWSGYHSHYSTTVILSLPLQKSHMKCMLTHSFVNVLRISHLTILQHNTIHSH